MIRISGGRRLLLATVALMLIAVGVCAVLTTTVWRNEYLALVVYWWRGWI